MFIGIFFSAKIVNFRLRTKLRKNFNGNVFLGYYITEYGNPTDGLPYLYHHDAQMTENAKVAKLRVAGCVWGILSQGLLHARCNPEGGGDGGEHGDDNVDDLAPKVFVHDFLIYDL